ncbi:lipoprotein NlpI [Legionella massiliensis]|uniref:Lipoprotein NlpI n=1 Tax=Legionella massiliensis TaxID=1034943 RepID=A0A078KZX3_9GAMM|nr:tetratricopeptide repeat protein [Legionella massiliensis]CDZ77353.1 lipoprotein NlpI [Legionella massiliensis]CEE13091.1 lipoprotein NlpI [Legionella massiliensis]
MRRNASTSKQTAKKRRLNLPTTGQQQAPTAAQLGIQPGEATTVQGDPVFVAIPVAQQPTPVFVATPVAQQPTPVFTAPQVAQQAAITRPQTYTNTVPQQADFISPSNYEALMQQIDGMLQSRNLDQALTLINQLFLKSPTNFSLLHRRATVYSMQGKWYEAEKDLTVLIAAYPQNAGYLSRRGLAYRLQEKFADAEKDYTSLLDIASDSDTIFRRGEVYLMQGKYSEAEHDLNRALHLGNDRALVLRGDLYRQMGKWQEAEDDLNQCLLRNPGSSLALVTRGDVYRRQGRLQEAEKDLTQALATAPTDEQALSWRGDVYRRQGKWQEAEKDFNQALRIDPANDFALLRRGHVYCMQNKWQEAEKDFTAVLRANPQNTYALSWRAEVYYRQELLLEAEQDLTQILRLEPANDFALLRRADVYCKQGIVYLAKQDLNRALDLCPTNDFALLQRAKLYHLADKLNEAQEEYKLAISYNKDNEYSTWGRLNFTWDTGGFLDAISHNLYTVIGPLTNFSSFISRESSTCLYHLNRDSADFSQLSFFSYPGSKSVLMSEYEIHRLEGLFFNNELSLQKKGFSLDTNTPENLVAHSKAQNKRVDYASKLERLRYLHAALQYQPGYLPALLARLEIWIQLGHQKEAFVDLNEILKQDPNHSTALALKARLYLMRNNPDDLENAEGELQNAFENDSDNAAAWAVKGHLCIRKKCFEEARQALTSALAKDPLNDYTLGLRGRALYHLDHFDEAEKDFQHALLVNPKNKNALQGLLKMYCSRESWSAAINIANQLIEYGHSSKALQLRSQAYYKLGKLEDALRDLKQLLFTKDYDWEDLLRTALIYFEQGELEDAKFLVFRSLARNPNATPTLWLSYKISCAQNQFQTATETIFTLMRTNKDSSNFLQSHDLDPVILGDIYYQQGNWSESEQMLTRVIDSSLNEKEKSYALTKRGLIYNKHYQSQMAEQDLLLAYTLDSENELALENLVQLYSSQNRWSDAEDILTKQLASNPEDVLGLQFRSKIYYNQGKLLEAIKDLHKLRYTDAKAETLTEALTLLARSYYDLHRLSPTDAVINYDDLEEDDDFSGDEELIQSNIEKQQENALQRAERYIKEALPYKLANETALVLYYKILRLQNKLPQAKEVLITLIRINPSFPLTLEMLEIQPGDTIAQMIRGQIFYHQDKWSEAEQDFHQVLSHLSKHAPQGIGEQDTLLNPSEEEVYLNRADVYVKQNRLFDALWDLQRVLTINPQNDLALTKQGEIFSKQKKWVEAEFKINQALAINPQNYAAWQQRIYINNAQEAQKKSDPLQEPSQVSESKFAKTEQGLLQLQELAPENLSLYQAQAFLQFKQGKFSEAEENLKRLILSGNPKYKIQALIILVDVYMKQEKWPQAQEVLAQALLLSPQNHSLTLKRALLYGLSDRWQAAVRDATQVLHADPACELALEIRSIGYLNIARDCLMEAKWANKNLPGIAVNKVDIVKNAEKAEHDLKQLLRLHPNNEETLLHLKQAYAFQGLPQNYGSQRTTSNNLGLQALTGLKTSDPLYKLLQLAQGYRETGQHDLAIICEDKAHQLQLANGKGVPSLQTFGKWAFFEHEKNIARQKDVPKSKWGAQAIQENLQTNGITRQTLEAMNGKRASWEPKDSVFDQLDEMEGRNTRPRR